VENLFEFDGGESTLADLDEGTDQISNHPIEKAVSVKSKFQNTILFFNDPNRADISDGRFSFVSWVGGKRSEVVFPSQNLGGFAYRGEIEGAWHVPGTPDF
jgi:hypothetical protein